MTHPDHTNSHSHFKDRDAMGHVAETQAQGIISSTEVHGTEVPGHIAAAADAARETAMALLLVWVIFFQWRLPPLLTAQSLSIFVCGWMVWKVGRSAWLGWSRLERLHRILEQERWEIQHHRPQEREELRVLYSTKGFEGKLLEDVLDVLMADDERLLRVMVEEEMQLSLESHEHPLKQATGALFGCLFAAVICLFGLLFFTAKGIILGSLTVVALAGGMLAYRAQNRLIPAIIWNLGIAVFALGCVYYLFEYFFANGYFIP